MAASGAARCVTLTLSGVLVNLVHILANRRSTEPAIGAGGMALTRVFAPAGGR